MAVVRAFVWETRCFVGGCFFPPCSALLPPIGFLNYSRNPTGGSNDGEGPAVLSSQCKGGSRQKALLLGREQLRKEEEGDGLWPEPGLRGETAAWAAGFAACSNLLGASR